MQLTFYGATKTVTGSKTLVETAGKKILIDCGLFQGFKELRLRNWEPFPVPPSEIDSVVLTHAHIDHSGYIPLLVKQGFRGKIYCTDPTFDLCKLLLPDSGYLHEEDAKRANKYRYSKHEPALPLYTVHDAEHSLDFFESMDFGKDHLIAGDITIRFERVGHILGASWVTLKSEKRSVLFSGDVGRLEDAVMKAPVAPVQTDYLVVESTYGDRRHDTQDPLDKLQDIILRTSERGGSVIIPSFAVGRAQSLIYYLWKLREENRIPHLPMYLDSPMAIKATNFLQNHLGEHKLDAALCAKIEESVTYVHTADESRELNGSNTFPKIIISASGMATGGRILHHLKHYAPDERNTILFAGFQAGGTRGDRMLRGEKEVKIHGQMVPINAEIALLTNMSAHADYEELLQWLGHISKPPIKTFVIHGDPEAASAMKVHLEERFDWECELPEYAKTYSL